MEIFWWIVGILWVIGWVREYAFISALTEDRDMWEEISRLLDTYADERPEAVWVTSTTAWR